MKVHALKRRRAVQARPHIRQAVRRAKIVAQILEAFSRPPQSAVDVWSRALAQAATIGVAAPLMRWRGRGVIEIKWTEL